MKKKELNEILLTIKNIYFHKIFIDEDENILSHQYHIDGEVYSSVVVISVTDDENTVNALIKSLLLFINDEYSVSDLSGPILKLSNPYYADKMRLKTAGISIVGNDEDNMILFSVLLEVDGDIKGSIIETELTDPIYKMEFKDKHKVNQMYMLRALDRYSSDAIQQLQLFNTPATKKIPRLLN